MDGQVNLTAFGQILDIAITAVLRSARDSPGAIFLYLFLDIGFGITRMSMRGIWRQGDYALEVSRLDELGFALIPLRQNLCRRCTSELAGVDNSREADMGDMARCRVDAFEVPNSLGSAFKQSSDSTMMFHRHKLTRADRFHPKNHLHYWHRKRLCNPTAGLGKVGDRRSQQQAYHQVRPLVPQRVQTDNGFV